MPTFDVVIATRNRIDLVKGFVKACSMESRQPENYIIVDSSDFPLDEIEIPESWVYYHTNYQNQPLQRFIGRKLSFADVVIFFDDDLQILKEGFFEKILSAYSDDEVVGSSVGCDMGPNQFGARIGDGSFLRLMLLLTGVPLVRPGVFGPVGVVGNKPVTESFVQCFSGAVMSFRREILPEKRIYPLFTYYQLKIGKGEDKFLSHLMSKKGKLLFFPEYYFKHPENESFYTDQTKNFAKRVTFSRYYLNSLFYSDKNLGSILQGFHFYYFLGWRLIIKLFMVLTRFRKSDREEFKGMLAGLREVWSKNGNNLDWSRINPSVK